MGRPKRVRVDPLTRRFMGLCPVHSIFGKYMGRPEDVSKHLQTVKKKLQPTVLRLRHGSGRYYLSRTLSNLRKW